MASPKHATAMYASRSATPKLSSISVGTAASHTGFPCAPSNAGAPPPLSGTRPQRPPHPGRGRSTRDRCSSGSGTARRTSPSSVMMSEEIMMISGMSCLSACHPGRSSPCRPIPSSTDSMISSQPWVTNRLSSCANMQSRRSPRRRDSCRAVHIFPTTYSRGARTAWTWFSQSVSLVGVVVVVADEHQVGSSGVAEVVISSKDLMAPGIFQGGSGSGSSPKGGQLT